MTDSPLVIFHLDLKVAQFKRNYLKGFFSRLERVGYTHVCFEIEDKVRLDSCPEAAWVEAWTKDEFSAILRDAREAGLGPFPLVQTLGHLEYLLRHGKYAPLRETPRGHAQICPSNPEAVKLVNNMCAEVGELFDNPPLFHIGGDETRSLGACTECGRRVATEGVSRLYIEHMRAICGPLIAAGSRPILWADIALAHPEALDELPRELVFCDWDYWTGEGAPDSIRIWSGGHATRGYPSRPRELPGAFMERFGEFLYPDGASSPPAPWFYTDYLRAKGYDVLCAPAARSSGDNMFFARQDHQPNCVGASVKALADGKALGVLLTSWAVRLNHVETQWLCFAVPGLVAATGKRTTAELMAAASETLGLGDAESVRRAHEALGVALPFTRSDGAVSLGLYGRRPEFVSEIGRFFSHPDAARHGVERAEKRLADYDEIEPALEAMRAGSGNDLVDARHWIAALRGMRHKAHLFLALAELVREGRRPYDRLDALENELAQVCDETADCLRDSYAPASVQGELQMRFGAERRFLMSDTDVQALVGK